MKRSEVAKEKFQCYNCCQSVLAPFAAEFGLDEKTILRIASGFGAGMGRGVTCGAVTGAYMVLGLKNDTSGSFSEAKARIKATMKKFDEFFTAQYGSLLCKELTGYDLSVPGEAEKASKAGVFDTICPHLVSSSVEIIDTKI